MAWRIRLDLLERNTKKIKSGVGNFSGVNVRVLVSYGDIGKDSDPRSSPIQEEENDHQRTYLESLMGVEGAEIEEDEDLEREGRANESGGEGNSARMQRKEIDDDDVSGFCFEADPDGDDACAVVNISEREKKRLGELFEQALIIKFLAEVSVKFSCVEDYEAALMNGPWVIFDHYLTIRPWLPEFDPSLDIIQKLAEEGEDDVEGNNQENGNGGSGHRTKQGGEKFGPWMTVCKTRRPRTTKNSDMAVRGKMVVGPVRGKGTRALVSWPFRKIPMMGTRIFLKSLMIPSLNGLSMVYEPRLSALQKAVKEGHQTSSVSHGRRVAKNAVGVNDDTPIGPTLEFTGPILQDVEMDGNTLASHDNEPPDPSEGDEKDKIMAESDLGTYVPSTYQRIEDMRQIDEVVELMEAFNMYVRKYRPNFISLLETKCNKSKAQQVFQAVNCNNFFCQEGRGFAGGIWVGWTDDFGEVEILKSDLQYVHICVKDSTRNWWLTVVYASPQDETRSQLWAKLKKIRSRFTWRRPLCDNRERVFEKLDRMLCNGGWRILYPEATVVTLPRVYLDHHPPLVNLHGSLRIRKGHPFRFEIAWMQHREFNSFVADHWGPNEHWNSLVLNFTKNIRKWNLEIFVHIGTRNNELLAKLGGIQKARNSSTNPFLDHLETGKNNLCCQVLNGKYGKGANWHNGIVTKVHDSIFWKNIGKVWTHVQGNQKWSIGNGNTVSFWKDSWGQGDMPLIHHATSDVEPCMLERSVSSYVSESGDWKIEELSDWLDTDCINRILNEMPPDPWRRDDAFYWGVGGDSKFTVKKAYFCLNHFGPSDAKWKWIWKLNVPERIRVFMWQTIHLKLPTKVWSKLVAPLALAVFFHTNFDDWVSLNINKGSGNDPEWDWTQVWVITMWMIWNWRNKALFDNDFCRPERPHDRVLEFVEHIKSATVMVDSLAPTVRKGEVLVDWEKPGMAVGCGALLRDHNGFWVAGVRLAQKLGATRIILKADSKILVDNILSTNSHAAEAQSIIEELQRMLRDFYRVQVQHRWREANTCANHLANLGTCDFHITVLAESLDDMRLKIFADIVGTKLPRVIAL
ncbi:ribonuclease H [Senna tora]|uniref:Ribonuclease H n=1 Tax=Senna tora TaxID=362788 RepID=A0A834TK16_9FABA|nr:ribonuclease H [Senna tora]